LQPYKPALILCQLAMLFTHLLNSSNRFYINRIMMIRFLFPFLENERLTETPEMKDSATWIRSVDRFAARSSIVQLTFDS
jgi:hypothetical protein